MKNNNYFLRPKAEDDLKKIYFYSLENFGLNQTEKYILNIEGVFQNLSDNPNMGKNRDEVLKGLKSFQIYSHVIFYNISKNTIIIERILHKSMDCILYL